MFPPVTTNDIIALCQATFGYDWLPSFIKGISWYSPQENRTAEKEMLEVCNLCQSELEIKYLLGIPYYLYSMMRRHGESANYPGLYCDEHEGQKGMALIEPFTGGVAGSGYSALLLIPQYRSPEKPITHDFGFFVAPDHNGGPPWYLYAAVDIIREADIPQIIRLEEKRRLVGLSYKVKQVQIDTMGPHDWYQLFDPGASEEAFNNMVTGYPFPQG